MAKVVYGSELSAELKQQMKQKIEGYVARGMRRPCLAVILAGDDPASHSYVKGKEKACQAVGIESRMHYLPATVGQKELECLIDALSQDDGVDGILVQLPLPKGLDEDSAILRISPDKDVDGLHPVNVGKFFLTQHKGGEA